MPKTKRDCGDPKCPFPDMPSVWKPEDTEADYFVKAALWMQGQQLSRNNNNVQVV